MSPLAMQILEKALALSEAERTEIAVRLFESIDNSDAANVDEAWHEEIRRRVRELETG